jgi:hypothetical protein
MQIQTRSCKITHTQIQFTLIFYVHGAIASVEDATNISNYIISTYKSNGAHKALVDMRGVHINLPLDIWAKLPETFSGDYLPPKEAILADANNFTHMETFAETAHRTNLNIAVFTNPFEALHHVQLPHPCIVLLQETFKTTLLTKIRREE